MPKNLVFILSDEHRWDAVRAWNPSVSTPNIDRLAESGVRFDNCFCVVQACAPSRGCLLTGRYCEEIGLWGPNDKVLGRHETTWPGHLSAHGFQTVAVGRTHHIDKGFDSVVRVPSGESYPTNCHDARLQAFWREDAHIGPSPASFDQYYETRITRTAIEFLREMRRGGEPFALYLGYLAPHSALTPPEPYWSMYADLDVPAPSGGCLPEDLRDWARRWGMDRVTPEQHARIVRGYYGMVSTVDACIGLVLDELATLGLAEDTLLVYTSDHGEMLGDRGLYAKGFGYDPAIRVPLVVSCPGTVRAGVVSTAPIELIDLAPTFTDALGVAAMPCSGRSAWGFLAGDQTGHRDWIYSALGNGQVCRSERFKWIHRIVDGSPRDEVYDLVSDPGELTDVSQEALGREVMGGFYPRLQDLAIGCFRRPITDFDPDAVQPRLLPFFTT